MDVEIRAARPEDRGSIAELMYSSSPDVYDFLCRSRAIEFLRFEFASGRGFAGYPNVTVALLDGEVVGTGCFYDRLSDGALRNGTVKNFFAYFGPLSALPVVWRSRHMSSVVRRPRPGELYLSNFGVSERLRGCGIGSKLIRHKLEEARQRGYRTFGLDVSTANPRGQALYTKLGLEVKKEKSFSDPHASVHAARKMELAL